MCIVGGGIKVHSTLRPILSAPGDYGNGEIGGMIGRGNYILPYISTDIHL
jgi:hypothetical protein